MIDPAIFEISFRESGISSFGLVGEESLHEAFSLTPAGFLPRLGIDGPVCAIAVALAYCEGRDFSPPSALQSSLAEYPGPLARLARFARADWYGELAARLKDASSRIRQRLRDEGREPGPAREWRYFVNSALPEKRLALEAGLGRPGRHGLVMLPTAGSAAVLGVLLSPARVSQSPTPKLSASSRTAPPLHPACENCGACAAACPTGALDGEGGFARERCIQHWSSVPGALPPEIEAAWGDRLYGCDSCQEACPRFSPDASAWTFRGHLGPGLPASWLVSAQEAEICAALKGTVLGMKWISKDALKRNAGLALRHQ